MHIALYENKMAFPLEDHIRPTLEVILIESPKHLQRKMDEETGLALITLP
jgi:predicted DNA-binding protein with PD1-like motif